MNRIALITGVGEGTGAALVLRFSQGGYKVAMLARNYQRLKSYEKEIPNTKAYPCDVGNLDKLLDTVSSVKKEMGDPSIFVHNAVSATFKSFLDANLEDLEKNFRVNTTSLLYIARELAPSMITAGEGAILVTGNTASHRGVPKYALFAPTKAAQRILAESLARDLGPKGIHVAYITVDAAIDVSWLKELNEKPDSLTPPLNWKRKRKDYYAKPSAIAEEVFHIAHQDKSTWSFDSIIRPYAEKW